MGTRIVLHYCGQNISYIENHLKLPCTLLPNIFLLIKTTAKMFHSIVVYTSLLVYEVFHLQKKLIV